MLKAKVLVIDDNLPAGQAMQWAMESAGHEVRVATNGVTAISQLGEFIPDIVLCDINMPKLDGYETCERMKKDPRLNHTLFIAQTGLSSANSKRLSAQAGFEYHLVKPIDINQLLELVFMKRIKDQAPSELFSQ